MTERSSQEALESYLDDLEEQTLELVKDNNTYNETLVLETTNVSEEHVRLNNLADFVEPQPQGYNPHPVILADSEQGEVNDWVQLQKPEESCSCNDVDDCKCDNDNENISFIDRSKDFFKKNWIWITVAAAAIIVSILLSKAFKKK